MKKIAFTLGLFFLSLVGFSQNFGYDIKYHRLEFEVDPAVNHIVGKVTTYYTPEIENFNEISFHLINSLIVDSVVADSVNLEFIQVSNKLNIQLGETIAADQLDSLTVYYHGAPGSTGFGSFITDDHAGHPIMWTLSEPYGAMSWWPCKQYLDEKADSLELIVTAPIGNKVAANGLLLSVDTIGTESVKYHWKHRYPITAYLVAFAVTNYAEYCDYVEVNDTLTVPILNYVYPEDLEYAQANSPNLIDVFQFFCEKFMIYPFSNEKYGHAQFGWGGGMEHQSMTFIVNFGHGLMAHELAHQWFGDYVTCASWADLWLNEGFAVYLEGMTAEAGLAPYDWSTWKQDKIDKVTSKPDGSVFCDDTLDVGRLFSSRLTYAKGGMVLHLLRWVVGDDAFFEGIRNYLHDPKLAYKNAYTADLKAHIEEASGKDLTYFFDDWFYGQGYPIYSIGWTQTSDKQVKIRINQTQSHQSVQFYELPLPIQLIGNDKDTLLVLENTENAQEFFIDLDFDVNELIFDPDIWILTKNTTISNVPDLASADIHVSLVPNPVKNDLIINFPSITEVSNISVFDVKGTSVFYQNVNEKLESTRVNLSELQKGIYFIKIQTPAGTVQKKFIKE